MPVHVAADLNLEGFYSDPSYSIIDPAKFKAYEEASLPASHLADEIANAADEYQTTGSTEAAQCALSLLLSAAHDNALAGTMHSKQAYYVQGWIAGSLAIDYLKIRHEVIVPDADRRLIEAWLYEIAEKTIDYYKLQREQRSNGGDAGNNHLYWAAMEVAAIGIVDQDKTFWEWGLAGFRQAIADVTPDGTLLREMARKRRALHYHLFAVSPLVMLAEFGCANGLDLYAENQDALVKLANRALGGLIDNTYFSAQSGTPQDTPNGSPTGEEIGWAKPFLVRFPNRQFEELLRTARSLSGQFTGGLPPMADQPVAPKAPSSSSAHHPEFGVVHVGAFDAEAWNGISFQTKVGTERVNFALRVGSKDKQFLDGNRINHFVSQIGPHAPDSSYVSIAWAEPPQATSNTMEWSRIDNTTVVGRLHAAPNTSLVLEAYSPSNLPFEGDYHLGPSSSEMLGEQHLDHVFRSAAQFLVTTDKPSLSRGLYRNAEALRMAMDAGQLVDDGDHFPNGAAGLQLSAPNSSTAHFVISLGWDQHEQSGVAQRLLSPSVIDRILDANAAHYEAERPRVRGLFARSAEAIAETALWNTTYIPSLDLEFPTISRSWSSRYGGWMVGEWDSFFDALLVGIEDPAQASAAIRVILGAQTSDGLVPNIAGGTGVTSDRSQPPIGAYMVWKNHRRNPDLDLLRWAYPRLKKWHRWWFADRGDGQPWRDGNKDGLLEWGSNKGSTLDKATGRGFLLAARLESGMDDSPMYDDSVYNGTTYTLESDDVGLNSLYVLDSECLARIAILLGQSDDAEIFSADGERVKALMQKRLWNENIGMYQNRGWDGVFSPTLSPSNFYPLIAGVATPSQATRIMKHLKNPDEFWGEYVLPTIARNDPSFKQQYYWRGDIWGPTNYLVYEGLNRYGQDAAALEFARKSYKLFMKDWESHQSSQENYFAWGGSAGGDPHYTWGSLLAFIPLEQFIDETPWDGLRFGALDALEDGSFSHFAWNGHRYAIKIGPQGTSVSRDDRIILTSSTSAVIRHYEERSGEWSFSIKTSKTSMVTIYSSTELTHRVEVDGRPIKWVKNLNNKLSFKIPEGEHEVFATSIAAQDAHQGWRKNP